MKKALALVLALVMAFSMSAMAFAADDATTTTKAAAAEEPVKTCPICGNEFRNAAEYNKHLEVCDVYGERQDFVGIDFTIKDILDMIVDLLKGSMGQWDNIEGVVIELIGFVEKITELGTSAVKEAEVKGAVADLEAALADVKIPALSDLLNSLKQKIKDLYAGEVATTIEETTAAEEIVETGSSSVGIALFAAVSVAAAAAYVCTKKSK